MPWKTSLIILVTNSLSWKVNKVSLMFFLERVKFLENLILSMGAEEAGKGERKKLVRINQCRKEKFKRKLRSTSLMTIL